MALDPEILRMFFFFFAEIVGSLKTQIYKKYSNANIWRKKQTFGKGSAGAH